MRIELYEELLSRVKEIIRDKKKYEKQSEKVGKMGAGKQFNKANTKLHFDAMNIAKSEAAIQACVDENKSSWQPDCIYHPSPFHEFK